MVATRAGVGSPGESTGSGPADLLAAASSLRWVRPDLTAALAGHALEVVGATGGHDRWLAAAGWLVHGRSATGDGRAVAAELLDGLSGSGFASDTPALSSAAAIRLRVELAQVAAATGENGPARVLLAPVAVDGTAPQLRADAFCTLARCAVADAPDQVGPAVRSADAAWSEVGGPEGEIGAASVAYVAAAAHRRAGRAGLAVSRAAGGLVRLEQGATNQEDGLAGAVAASPFLAAALAAEWICALLDAGRVDEGRRSCIAVEPLLVGPTRASRQLARLRLTVARVRASEAAVSVTADELDRAAREAADCDAPDLEAVCRSASGAVYEEAGRLDAAVEALRLGVDAERRDRDRDGRFSRALAAVAPRGSASGASVRGGSVRRAVASSDVPAVGRAAAVPTERPPVRRSRLWPDPTRERPAPQDDVGALFAPVRPDAGDAPRPGSDDTADPATRWLLPGPEGSRVRDDDPPTRAPRDDSDGADADRSAWDIPWRGSAGESPIGEGLMRSLRSGAHPARPDDRSGGDRRPARDDDPAAPGDRPTAAPDPAGQRDRRVGRNGWTGASERSGDRRTDIGRSGRQWPGLSTEPAPGTPRAAGPGRDLDRDADVNGPSATGGPDAGWAESWRRSALEDIDRIRRRVTEPEPPASERPTSDRSALDRPARDWSALGPPATEPPATEPPERDPRVLDTQVLDPRPLEPAGAGAVGCVVALDVIRGGRRFVGRRTASVVRAVADRLADRLPTGAQLRREDADALAVVLPGWSRAAATDWMRRTLPVLLEGHVADEDMSGMQLRAAVHGSDGPVGAQILQPLDRAAGTQRGPASRGPVDEPGAGVDDRRARGAATGPWRAAGPESRAPEEPPGTDPRPGNGRHDAAGRAPFRAADRRSADGPAGRGGPRRATEPTTDGPSAERSSPPATDGLGLADLLAGALAAYRGI